MSCELCAVSLEVIAEARRSDVGCQSAIGLWRCGWDFVGFGTSRKKFESSHELHQLQSQRRIAFTTFTSIGMVAGTVFEH